MRSVATVLTISGRLDTRNVDLVAAQAARYTRLDDPLVVDVRGLDVDDEASFERLSSLLDAECHLHGIGWVLVTDAGRRDVTSAVDDVALEADSVPEALQHLIGMLHGRRHMRLTG